MQTLNQLFNKMTYQNFLQYRTHVKPCANTKANTIAKAGKLLPKFTQNNNELRSKRCNKHRKTIF